MKKTLSVILVAVMLLSTLVALVVPAAADGEGNWEVYNTATIDTPEELEKAPPVPGYEYDDEGFHTVSPDYTNYNPKFTVVSKEQYNITNFSMTVVIHDYVIADDNWLSFSIWSESNGMAQGDVSGDFGYGWTSLIRGDVTNQTLNRFESWNCTMGRKTQNFVAIDGTQLQPVVFDEVTNDAGDRVIQFSIVDGVVMVNGKTVGTGTDSLIQQTFTDGLAYVAVTLHNTRLSDEGRPTISVIEVNGEVPTGSDNRAPEDKSREIAPIAPSDTVPAGQPAIWFDASLEATNDTMPMCVGGELAFAEDNSSFHVDLMQDNFQLHFAPPDTISYEAADFPYFAIIYKNFCHCTLAEDETAFDACDLGGTSQQTTVWYFAGETKAATNTGYMQVANYYCINPLNEDGTSATEDFYTVAVFKIVNPEYWTGRINGYRLDVSGLTHYDVEGRNYIEILGTGFFRSSADLTSYIGNMSVDGNNFNVEDIKAAFWDCEVDGHISDEDGDGYCDLCWDIFDTGEVCEHADEDADNVCDLCGADLGENNGGDTSENTSETNTEANSENNAENNTQASAGNDDTDSDDKGGCGSVVSMGALAIVAIVGTGLVIKKKED